MYIIDYKININKNLKLNTKSNIRQRMILEKCVSTMHILMQTIFFRKKLKDNK